MPMYTRCKSCRADVLYKPDVLQCPECGSLLGKLLRTARAESTAREKSRPAGGKKQARRVAALQNPATFRAVLRHDEGGLRLEAASGTRKVRVTSNVPAWALLDIALRWRATEGSDGVLDAWPEECGELKRIRTRLAAAAKEESRHQEPSELDPRFCAQLPGTSPLEKMTSRMKQAREIDRLAELKDDPEAWATLANGYRVEGIRHAIDAAVLSIGPEKFASMFLIRPGDWPHAFVSFINAEMLALRAKRKKPGMRKASWYELDDS